MSEVARRGGSLSGLEFRVLSRELTTGLAGSYVSNIYSLGENQVFRLRRGSEGEAGGAEASLLLSPKHGAWLTERPTRVETSEFTSSLRSHLLRRKLTSVSQLDLDRVLVFAFEERSGEGRLRLTLELMPPGNLLLTDADGLIVTVLREVRAPGRRLSKGRPYEPPQQSRTSIDTVSKDELTKLLADGQPAGRSLGRGLSLPRRYIDEILARIGSKQDDRLSSSPKEVDTVMGALRGLLEEVDESPFPCLVRSGQAEEVMVVRPRSAVILRESPTLSALLDDLFYPEHLAGEGRGKGPHGGGPETSETERRVLELRGTIADLESKKERLSVQTAQLRTLAREVSSAPGAEEGLALARRSEGMSKSLLESLQGASAKGKASLASAIFDRAKQEEHEIQEIETAIDSLRSKLKREVGRTETRKAKTVSLARSKKEWYEKFRWFYTTGGKLAIGGRDAQSNTLLIRRHLQPDDTVYHADLFGSPFFVLKGGKEQNDAEVKEVAKATVTFSSAWKTGLAAADAYWVWPDQLATAGPSGEYLAHGSFAIKGKKNFVTKNPVEVAVGFDESGRILSGPEECVMKTAVAHVTVIPSRDKPSDTAKKVIHELEKGAQPEVSLALDDVLRMLPAGGGKVVRRRVDKKGEPSSAARSSAAPGRE